jgi:hypothetical protein
MLKMELSQCPEVITPLFGTLVKTMLKILPMGAIFGTAKNHV